MGFISCNNCADIREQRNRSWWTIRELMGELLRWNTEYKTATDTRRQKISEGRKTVEVRLLEPSREFIKAVARQRKVSWSGNPDKLVKRLVEAPTGWERLLHWLEHNLERF